MSTTTLMRACSDGSICACERDRLAGVQLPTQTGMPPDDFSRSTERYATFGAAGPGLLRTTSVHEARHAVLAEALIGTLIDATCALNASGFSLTRYAFLAPVERADLWVRSIAVSLAPRELTNEFDTEYARIKARKIVRPCQVEPLLDRVRLALQDHADQLVPFENRIAAVLLASAERGEPGVERDELVACLADVPEDLPLLGALDHIADLVRVTTS